MFRSSRTIVRIIALCASFAALTASGYVLEGPRWPAGTNIVLQLSLGAPVTPLQDGSASWNDAVAPVADMWNAVLGSIHLSNAMNSSVIPNSNDRQYSVAFGTTAFNQTFGSSTLAITLYHYSNSSMIEADTIFNIVQHFDSYRGPLQFMSRGPALADIRRVFLHELGHGLGLNHPDSAGQHVTAVMNSVVGDQATLSADDIAGGQALYGAPVNQPTPTPVPIATPTPQPTATPIPPAAASHLVNISTRLRVGTNDNVLIGGFIINGTQPKTVIVRGIGPSLGVPGELQDPYLELHDASGRGVASNDDWQSGSQVNELNASGVAPSHPNEAAMIVTLNPGSYTAIVSGYDNVGGVALVEVYEYDSNASRLVNISTRGAVATGDEALIGGFIVQGGASKNVIVRAVGPSLASSTTGALTDPTLELRDGAGNLISANDNFTQSAQYSQIVATGVAPTDARESAIRATLAPGNYTAVVRGSNDTAGIGMVEVFDLD
jgi:hypothetical protein